uniref:Uncharacterized protein n=1 Tax=Arion vulgaris TaxID=1028688 RepID=A0A0B6Z779_9EUPU
MERSKNKKKGVCTVTLQSRGVYAIGLHSRGVDTSSVLDVMIKECFSKPTRQIRAAHN